MKTGSKFREGDHQNLYPREFVFHMTNRYGMHRDAQPKTYSDYMNRFKGENRWIGFIDTDEQIDVKNDKTLPEFLKDYEGYAALYVVWVIYRMKDMKKTDEPRRRSFIEMSHGDDLTDL